MSVDFLDTNLFIYQLDGSDERKAEVADSLIKRGIQTGDACISFQVVQELMNVALRKAEVPLAPHELRSYLDLVLAPLYRAGPSVALYHRALDVQERYRYGFYDSLIIAAALEAGCDRLLTEDMQDGQRIEQLVIRNPFLG